MLKIILTVIAWLMLGYGFSKSRKDKNKPQINDEQASKPKHMKTSSEETGYEHRSKKHYSVPDNSDYDNGYFDGDMDGAIDQKILDNEERQFEHEYGTDTDHYHDEPY